MRDALIYLDRDSRLGLQAQIRQKLVDGITSGAFAPGTRLPSSRKLAEQLEVARNTVVAVYQELIADGYITSRQRSGIYVSDEIPEQRLCDAGPSAGVERDSGTWRRRLRDMAVEPSAAHEFPDWHDYAYPFIDGKFDASLFPLAEWREASKLALSVADVEEWATGAGDADDPMLIEEIRTKFLTRRGIQARPDEILITLGTQNGLYIVSQLLANRRSVVAIEEPGNFRMRGLVADRGAEIWPQAVDGDGLVVDNALRNVDLVYVTPSHQIPTAVAMSPGRRHSLMRSATANDFLIVEDDYECEINYLDHPQPALKSMDTDGRVIYVAELSKVLSPGIRLGFIVADPRFIRRARQLRRALFNHPPLNNQRTAAFFLSLGYYDSMMLKLGRKLRERRLELRDALSNMRGVPLEISPEVGGTTYWVRAPRRFNVAFFIREAAGRGILLEPVEQYYSDADAAENCFRMGVTSLPGKKIVPGVRRLVDLIRLLVREQVEHLDSARGEWLRGDRLEQVMSGATVYYKEVYGTLCTIRLHPDGSMSGTMGTPARDRDTGSWRTDGERFYRRWDRWNYAAESAYYIVVDGDEIKYFNADRQIVDSARIATAGAAA